MTAVEATAKGPAGQVRESNGGEGANGQHEVFADATDDGWLEVDCSNCADPGSPYRLGTAASLTRTATIASDREATLYLYEFAKRNGSPVDMSGTEVTVTLHFADGSSKEVTFTAADPY